MADPQQTDGSAPDVNKGEIAGISDAIPSVTLPENSGDTTANGGECATSKALTAEEQMALYEKELKESDWGHQPC